MSFYVVAPFICYSLLTSLCERRFASVTQFNAVKYGEICKILWYIDKEICMPRLVKSKRKITPAVGTSQTRAYLPCCFCFSLSITYEYLAQGQRPIREHRSTICASIWNRCEVWPHLQDKRETYAMIPPIAIMTPRTDLSPMARPEVAQPRATMEHVLT